MSSLDCGVFTYFSRFDRLASSGARRKSGLQLFDGIVEFALTAIDAGQTHVRYPKVGKLFRV